MVNPDPVDHYCSLVLETINEGGSKISNYVAGLTSDMGKGKRWTINAFDTSKANKDETPKMKEENENNGYNSSDDTNTFADRM